MNIPISVIFSVITFFLGFIIREWILLHKKNKNLQNQNGYIQWSLDNIINAIPSQILGLDNLQKSIKTEDYRNWFIEPKLRPKIILEKQELLHTLLFDRKKGRINDKKIVYNKLIGSCSMLVLILEECTREFEQQNEKILHYENLLESTGVKLYQRIIELELKDNLNDTEIKVKKLYDLFCKNRTGTRSNVYHRLIEPLENMLIDLKYPKAIDYISHTSMYYKDYVFYTKILEQFSEKIKEYRDNLIFLHKELDNYNGKYKEMSFKNNWKN